MARTLERMTDEERLGQLLCVIGAGLRARGVARWLGECVAACCSGREGGQIRADRRRWMRLPVSARHAANLEEGGSGGASDATYFAWPMTSRPRDDPAWRRVSGRLCARRRASAWTELRPCPTWT